MPSLASIDDLNTYLMNMVGIRATEENDGKILLAPSTTSREEILHTLIQEQKDGDVSFPELDGGLFPNSDFPFHEYTDHDLCRLYARVIVGLLIFRLADGRDTWDDSCASDPVD